MLRSFRSIRTLDGAMPVGRLTATNAWPPETRSARLDSTSMTAGCRVGRFAACDAGAAMTAAQATAHASPRMRRDRAHPGAERWFFAGCVTRQLLRVLQRQRPV